MLAFVIALVIFLATGGYIFTKLPQSEHPLLVVFLFLVIAIPILLGLLIPPLLKVPLFRAVYFGIIAVALLVDWIKFDNRFFLGAAVLAGVVSVASFKGFDLL